MAGQDDAPRPANAPIAAGWWMHIDGSRNYALDLARGFCLILMVIDHLPLNPLDRVSNASFGPLGFFSGVSAFVFISGVVSAKAYGLTFLKSGLGATWLRVLRRVGQLYVVNFCIFFALLAAVALHAADAPLLREQHALFYSDPLRSVALGLVLLYRPGFLDVLPVYMLLLLAVPFLLQARAAGWGWRIIALSFAVWLAAQFTPLTDGALNPFAFQLLFVIGFVVGTIPDLEQRIRAPILVRILQLGLVAAVALLLLRLYVGYFGVSFSGFGEWRHALVRIDNVGVVRVANFAVAVMAAIYLWPKIPRAVKRDNPVARWVGFLGRHSLPVFAWSIVATYVSEAMVPREAGGLWGAVNMVLIVTSLTVPALLDDYWKKRRPRLGRALHAS